jgi:UDP-glucuronate 4-epimerase
MSVISAGRILVTGAYGLIGHAVTIALRNASCEVIPTDLLETRPDDAQFLALPLLIGDADALSEFLIAHRVHAIVHAAGISGPMLARDRPHKVFGANVAGTLDLLEAARRTGMGRVVLLSSASVYGRTGDEIIDERAQLGANDVYGASKAAGELIARAYHSRHGVDVVTLRPSWVYGPRRRTSCVIRTMIVDALAGRPTRLIYGKGFPRQFVHVEDVSAAIVSALSVSDISGHVFNLTDGARRTLDEVADLVCAVLPQAEIHLDTSEAPDDEYLGLLDIREAAKRLSWRPRTTLETGIRSYVDHLIATKAIR